jgi:hypothetical protein
MPDLTWEGYPVNRIRILRSLGDILKYSSPITGHNTCVKPKTICSFI